MKRNPPLNHLRQVGAVHVAAIVQLRRIPLRTVTIELLFPFHHAGLASVLRNQPADAVTTLAAASRALDAQHIELALDVTEYEIRPRHVMIVLTHIRNGPRPAKTIFDRDLVQH